MQGYDIFNNRNVFQSAPAIAGGRISTASVASRPGSGRFNPRPPLLAGESTATTVTQSGPRCFNPRPPLLAGESCGSPRRTGGWRRFNPRPPLLAGESCNPPCCSAGRGCFNPRPPLLAGESLIKPATMQEYHVSIRARHCWRANPAAGVADGTIALFQSAPAIAGGRIILSSHLNCSPMWFQSAPAIAGGRIRPQRSN